MFTFYIIYPLFWLLSLLPYRILYLKSYFLYLIIYYVIGYRKKVVFNNFRNSFPEKNGDEIKKFAKDFYRNFCALLVEFIKMISISEKQLKKRCIYKNIEIFDEYYKANKSVILVEGHYCHWETCVMGIPLFTRQKCFGIYQPLSTKYFDRLMHKSRSRTGVILMPMRQAYRIMLKYKNEPTINVFLIDQSPPKNGIDYWTTFLNQDTPFFATPEKIAKRLNFAVVFLKNRRIKRGFYEIEFIRICDEPDKTTDFEITEKYIRLLETAIKENPEYWLWSHKRWKHRRE